MIKRACFVVCGWAAAVAGAADLPRPFVHPLFSDHAVLQREAAVPVWGWAEPGTRVTVAFGGQSAEAVAGPDGQWLARLSPMPASTEPRVLTIRGEGRPGGEVSDVLVGDVWLCSGQSNMEMGIGACQAESAIASADFPQIRLLTVPRRVAAAPVAAAECRWLPCSPETVLEGLWGGFSAAGFFFGRSLHRELGVPIGLIHSSWGGTVAEAWTSREGLTPLGDFAGELARLSADEAGGELADPWAPYAAWSEQNDPGAREDWQRGPAAADGWRSVSMPGHWEQAGLPEFDGIVWLTRSFDAPASWAGQDLDLALGPIDDLDSTWINGTLVGRTTGWSQPRQYRVPAGTVRPGANTLTVQVLDTAGAGGLAGQPDQLRIGPAGAAPETAVSLAGAWLMRESAPLSGLPAPPLPPDPNNPNVATVLFNGMIAPLVPYALKGAIWYQGESNADRAWQYRRLLPAMIGDWRTRFGVGAFPFYIVQLAAYQAPHPEPRENTWAELREAQALTTRILPHCGLAVTIDIGDANDIHPKDKETVGERLARCALAQAYGKDIPFSGPWYRAQEIADGAIRLHFDHVHGGLTTRGGPLAGFAIAGADRRFVWADAVIDGDCVRVASPAVPAPVAVRYAWDINPRGNLYNQAGLPAVPFRTDDWPLTTASP